MKLIHVILSTSLLLLTSCIIRTTTDTTSTYESSDENYSFIQTYEVTSPASLEIYTSGGNIKTYGYDCDSIEVTYVIRQRGRVLDMTLEELKDISEVEIAQSDSGLSISVRHINPRNISVGFIIKTPFETSVLLKTSGGNITVEDITGTQKIRTSGGNLHLNNLTGEVDAGTSGGNIHVSSVKGNTDVNTSGGGIHLNDLSGSVKAHTSGGSVTATIRELTGWLDLETSGGNINATIPSNLGLELDLRAEHINTNLKNFSGSSSKRRINGQMNGGGIPVRMSTTGGSLSLNYD
jgi:hypothetical protein